jgi:hypothetical protein
MTHCRALHVAAGRRKGWAMQTCFVVMGFGEKTDSLSDPQWVLNLNKTYVNIIKPTVEEAGLACVRADEIIHATLIDKPMYEQLLVADLVIAGLSTSNANAVYELGVRHALKPWGTTVVAEKNFSFPLDLGHVVSGIQSGSASGGRARSWEKQGDAPSSSCLSR